MHFDVPKVVRSPGCDHGHDEESRNGRDIKIDILEAYVWTSESFRVKSAILPEHRGVTGTPPGVIGPWWAKREKRRERGRGGRAPHPPSPNRTREGGAAPPFPSFPPLPSSPPPIPSRSPTPGGSRTPSRRAKDQAGGLPLAPLYTGAGGHPNTHKLIFVIVP